MEPTTTSAHGGGAMPRSAAATQEAPLDDNRKSTGDSITKAAQQIFRYSPPLIVFFVGNPESVQLNTTGFLPSTTRNASPPQRGSEATVVTEQTQPEVEFVMKRMEKELHEVDASGLVMGGGPSIPGAAVPLSFAKASTVYHHGGAALHVFLIFVPRRSGKGSSGQTSSRIKRAAAMAKEWRDEILRTGGSDSNCLIFMLHIDLIEAGHTSRSIDEDSDTPQPPSAVPSTSSSSTVIKTAASFFSRIGGSSKSSPVEEALESVQEYIDDFQKRIPNTPRICVFHPSSYRERIVEALKDSYHEQALRLKAARHQSHMARSAPGWCLQEFWRKGFDLALHHLRYGAVHEAISCFSAMFTEYYNHSDDFGFVSDWSFLRDVGQVANVLDPQRSMVGGAPTATTRLGYPHSLADTAEVIDGLLYIVGAEMTCALFLGNREGALARFVSFYELIKEKFAEYNKEDALLSVSTTQTQSARHSATTSFDEGCATGSATTSVMQSFSSAAATNHNAMVGMACGPGATHGRCVAPPMYLQQFFTFRAVMSALDLCTGSNLAARVGSLVQSSIANGGFAGIDETTANATHVAILGTTTSSHNNSPIRRECTSHPVDRVGRGSDEDDDDDAAAGNRFDYSIQSIEDLNVGWGVSGGSSRTQSLSAAQRDHERYCVVVGELCLSAREHLVALAELCGFDNPSLVSNSASRKASTNIIIGSAAVLKQETQAVVNIVDTAQFLGEATTPSLSSASPHTTELRKWLGLECIRSGKKFNATYLSMTRVAASALRKGMRSKQSHSLVVQEAAALLTSQPRQSVDMLYRIIIPYYENTGWEFLLRYAQGLLVEGVRRLLQDEHRVAKGDDHRIPPTWYRAALHYALDRALTSCQTKRCGGGDECSSDGRAFWCSIFHTLLESHAEQMHNDDREKSSRSEATTMGSSAPPTEPITISGVDGVDGGGDALLQTVSEMSSTGKFGDGNADGASIAPLSLPYVLHHRAFASASHASASSATATFVSPSLNHARHGASGPVDVSVQGHLVSDTVSISCVKRASVSRIHHLLQRSARGDAGNLQRASSTLTKRLSSDALLKKQLSASSATAANEAGLRPLPCPKWLSPSGPPLEVLLDENFTIVIMIACSMDLQEQLMLTSEQCSVSLVLHSKKTWSVESEPVHMVELNGMCPRYDGELRALVVLIPFTPCHAGTYRVATLRLDVGALPLVQHFYSGASTASQHPPLFDDGSQLYPPEHPGGPEGTVAQRHRKSVVLNTAGMVATDVVAQQDGAAKCTLFVTPEPDAGIELSVSRPPSLPHCFGDSVQTFDVDISIAEPLRAAPVTPTRSTTVSPDGERSTSPSTVVGSASEDLSTLAAAPRRTLCYFEGGSTDGMAAVQLALGKKVSQFFTPQRQQRMHPSMRHGSAEVDDFQQPQSNNNEQELLAQLRIGRPPRRERSRGAVNRVSTRASILPRHRSPSDGGIVHNASFLGDRGGPESPPTGGGLLSGTAGGGPMFLLDATATQRMDDDLGGMARSITTRPPQLSCPPRHPLLFASLPDGLQSCLPHWTPLDHVTVFPHKQLGSPRVRAEPGDGLKPTNEGFGTPPRTSAQVTSEPAAAVAHGTSPPGGADQPEENLAYHRGLSATIVTNDYTSKLLRETSARTNVDGEELLVDGYAHEPSGFTTVNLSCVPPPPSEKEEDLILRKTARESLLLAATKLAVTIPLFPAHMKMDHTPLTFACRRSREISLRHTILDCTFLPAFDVVYSFTPFQERVFATATVTNILPAGTGTILWIRHAVLDVFPAERTESSRGYYVHSTLAANARVYHSGVASGDAVALTFELRLLPAYRCLQEVVRHGVRLCLAYSLYESYVDDGVFPLPNVALPQDPGRSPSPMIAVSSHPLEDAPDQRWSTYHTLDSLRQLHEATSCNVMFCTADHFTSKHHCVFSVMLFIAGADDDEGGDDEDAEEEVVNYPSDDTMDGGNGYGGVPPALEGSRSGRAEEGLNGVQPLCPSTSSSDVCDHQPPQDDRLQGQVLAAGASRGLHDVGEAVHFVALVHAQPNNWPCDCDPEGARFLVSVEVNPAEWMVLGRMRHVRVLTEAGEHHVRFSATPIGSGSSVSLPSMSIRRLLAGTDTEELVEGEPLAVDVVKARASLRLRRPTPMTILRNEPAASAPTLLVSPRSCT